MHEIEEANQAVAALQVEPKGTLRITDPVVFGTTVLGEWIAMFLPQYDRIRVDVLLTNQSLDLAVENIDVAFRWMMVGFAASCWAGGVQGNRYGG